MKFHSSVIFVNDIEKSKDFYIRLLNQKIEHDFGKNVIFNGGLTIWEIQQDHIISQQLETKNKSNKFELYFEDELIDKAKELLLKENVEFLHDIHEEPWGQRTIRFFDPDKHLLISIHIPATAGQDETIGNIKIFDKSDKTNEIFLNLKQK